MLLLLLCLPLLSMGQGTGPPGGGAPPGPGGGPPIGPPGSGGENEDPILIFHPKSPNTSPLARFGWTITPTSLHKFNNRVQGVVDNTIIAFSELPRNYSSVDADGVQLKTFDLNFTLPDGKHTIEVYGCQGTGTNNCPHDHVQYTYTWWQISESLPSAVLDCPATIYGNATDYKFKVRNATCPSLPNEECPSGIKLSLNYKCMLKKNPNIQKQCDIGSSSTSVSECMCDLGGRTGNWSIIANLLFKGQSSPTNNSISSSTTCQFTSQSNNRPVPIVPPVLPPPQSSDIDWIALGPSELDTRPLQLDQTKVKYTFMLGKKGIESGNLECCLQDSTKTKCTEYVKCGQIQSDRINSMYFPNITYTMQLQDGLHKFMVRINSTSKIAATYLFRTLRSPLSRPSQPRAPKVSVSNKGATHSSMFSIHMVADKNTHMVDDLIVKQSSLQYRFGTVSPIPNDIPWITKALSSDDSTDISLLEIEMGLHTFEARTLWSTINYLGNYFELPMASNHLYSKPFDFSWNRVEGTHTSLDFPIGIDHDCTDSSNPFFGKGDNVCAGHVYDVPSMTLQFHAVGMTECTFQIDHIGHGLVSPDATPLPCIASVDATQSTCSSLSLTTLSEGFHSVSILSVCEGDIAQEKTWANFTVDTTLPTCVIDLSAHPVQGCVNGEEQSGKCITHLSEATFGATSNENVIYFYALDPTVQNKPSDEEWIIAPNQLDPNVARHPSCHSSFEDCYAASKSIHGIAVHSLAEGHHTIYIRAIDEAGHKSDYATYNWTYVPSTGHPGLARDIKVEGGTNSVTNNFQLPIVVSWKAPKDNGGSPITSYDLVVAPLSPLRMRLEGTRTIKDVSIQTENDLISTTFYVEEGVGNNFQIISNNKEGSGPASQPKVNYIAKDLNIPCSTVDCNSRGTCIISSSNKLPTCQCLPFHSTSPTNAADKNLQNIYCDVDSFDEPKESTPFQIYSTILSGYNGTCDESCNTSDTTTGNERRGPLKCVQLFEKRKIETNSQEKFQWFFNLGVEDNTCASTNNDDLPTKEKNVMDTWDTNVKKVATTYGTKICNYKGQTCGAEYLVVTMDVVDGNGFEHISVMLATPSGRLHFEKNLMDEFHLMINALRIEQITITNVEYKKGKYVDLPGHGVDSHPDRATVTIKIMPYSDGGLSISECQKSLETKQTDNKILAETRWLRVVDPSSLSVVVQTIGTPNSQILIIDFPYWIWYAIGAGIVLMCVLCVGCLYCVFSEKGRKGARTYDRSYNEDEADHVGFINIEMK